MDGEPAFTEEHSEAFSDNEETSDELIQFIPYKNNTDAGSTPKTEWAYPDEWKLNIGLSHNMRARRDRLTDTVTEADILVDGTCAVNPLIGEIPSKEQALEELESLLIEM